MFTSGAKGGFDAVIGNPPYIDSEWLVKTNPSLRDYCNSHYESATGNWDIFCIFIEKSLRLCKYLGLSSLIIPNKLLSADYASGIRDYILNSHTLINIQDYSSVKVFPVSVYPIIYVAKSGIVSGDDIVKVNEFSQNDENGIFLSSSNQLKWKKFFTLGNSSWSYIFSSEKHKIIEKVQNQSVALNSIATINGAATVAEAYEWKEFIFDLEDETKEFLMFVNTGTIDRYKYLWGKKKTRYLKNSYLKPVIKEKHYQYLKENRLTQATQPKIIAAGMCKFLECNYDQGGYIAGKSTSIITSEVIDLLLLLGILNSKLLSFYYSLSNSGLTLQGGYFRIGPPQLKRIPIRISNNNDSLYTHIISKVKILLELNKQYPKTPHENELLQRTISATDAKIDRLVYDLYGLTEEEIKIVEDNYQ